MVFLEIVKHTINGEKWTCKSLAMKFKLPEGVMNSAWSRKLKPLLAKIQDWLD